MSLPKPTTWEATGIPWGDGESETLAVTADEFERVAGRKPWLHEADRDFPGRYRIYPEELPLGDSERSHFRGEMKLTITRTPVREISDEDLRSEFGWRSDEEGNGPFSPRQLEIRNGWQPRHPHAEDEDEDE